MRLTNKVAIITGAGSGIGRTSALLFAREGAKLVVADINDTGGEETVESIKASDGEAIFVHTDVSLAAEVENLAKVAEDRFGRVDILFNNAGINMARTAVEDIEEDFWDRMYAINVKGIFLAAKYIAPEIKKTGGGVIINTASTLGISPQVYLSPYSSSKAAIINLTKALAGELAPTIRVNCINPTAVETPMMKRVTKERMEELVKTIVLRRICKPEDIAYAALYLASDESSMVTGTSITVDGGIGLACPPWPYDSPKSQ